MSFSNAISLVVKVSRTGSPLSSARTLTTITSSLRVCCLMATGPGLKNLGDESSATKLVENKISDSLSSSIYLDGAVNTVVESNSITGSSKEGICLDYGCLNVTLFFNQILHNGDRYNKSDDDSPRTLSFNMAMRTAPPRPNFREFRSITQVFAPLLPIKSATTTAQASK